MPLQKECCSLELARQLKELGVEQSSLYYYNKFSNTPLGREDYKLSPFKLSEAKEHYSAFTSSELGEMLPRILNEKAQATDYKCDYWLGISKTKIDEQHPVEKWEVSYCGSGDAGCRHIELSDTMANAMASMMVYLLKNNLI